MNFNQDMTKAVIAISFLRAVRDDGGITLYDFEIANKQFLSFMESHDLSALYSLISQAAFKGLSAGHYATSPTEPDMIYNETLRLAEELSALLAEKTTVPLNAHLLWQKIEELAEEVEALKQRQPTIMYGPFA